MENKFIFLGCSDIYTSIGPCRKPMSSYVLDKFTSITQAECENHCNNNSGCKGFRYSTSIFGSSCELSPSSFFEISIICSTVVFVRHCPAGTLKYFKSLLVPTKAQSIGNQYINSKTTLRVHCGLFYYKIKKH